eukprot:353445-Chlamydomonas_euryale.AAC.8
MSDADSSVSITVSVHVTMIELALKIESPAKPESPTRLPYAARKSMSETGSVWDSPAAWHADCGSSTYVSFGVWNDIPGRPVVAFPAMRSSRPSNDDAAGASWLTSSAPMPDASTGESAVVSIVVAGLSPSTR